MYELNNNKNEQTYESTAELKYSQDNMSCDRLEIYTLEINGQSKIRCNSEIKKKTKPIERFRQI